MPAYRFAKLRKHKALNLSYNRVSGSIPAWLGSMLELFALNLAQNHLLGELPQEIFQLPALIAGETDHESDLSYLALPFLFDSLQYNRLFNFPSEIKLGNNSLTGNIPVEIGQPRLVHELDLSNNNLSGNIPDQLSQQLSNSEKLDVSGNHLSGEIPQSLVQLHFLSSFSVANNDLQGEILRGGQFDTFPASAYEGNPKLCGPVQRGSCIVTTHVDPASEGANAIRSWYEVSFGMGYLFGLFVIGFTWWFIKSLRCLHH